MKKSLGWLLKPRCWSNTYLHVWNSYFLLRKRSTLLHFCWLNAHFTKGGSLQNQAEEQITYQLCHMYSRADKSVGYATPAYMADHACHWDARAIFFQKCWSNFANTFAETKIWPIQIIQNATGFSLKALFYISVFRGVDIQDEPTMENLQIQVLKMEAHSSPRCWNSQTKKTSLEKIEKWCISIFAGYMQNFCLSKKKYVLPSGELT